MKRLNKKIAIITGAASGIGKAITQRFSSEGANVVIADYAKDKADVLAKNLASKGANTFPIYFSADNLESCRQLINSVFEHYGQIDILINNIGGSNLTFDKDIEHLDINYFDEIFHINIRCATYLTQLVIPFLERQNGGNIINIASISGITGDYQGTYYGIPKAGIISLTQYTATQMGKKNIRCNAIAPGLILTPAALNNLPEKNRQSLSPHHNLPRNNPIKSASHVVEFLPNEDF